MLTLVGPEMPAEFSHLTLKEYCFPGHKSLTVSSEGGEVEVVVSTVHSFPLSERYVTMYLNGPTVELRHPLNVSLTDRAVMVPLSIDTLGLDGAVCKNVKCNNKPKVVRSYIYEYQAYLQAVFCGIAKSSSFLYFHYQSQLEP